MVTITLLGPPHILLDGVETRVSRRKSRGLLFYLAAQDSPVSRDELMTLLWPDLERTGAQQSLRTTLYGLRKALGEDVFTGEERLALTEVIDVDVRSFDRQLKTLAGRAAPVEIDGSVLAETLDLYRGEFLQGFYLPDAEEFDEWQRLQAEHYRRKYIRGLDALSGQYEQDGKFHEALDTINRALVLDELQEDLQRSALRLHVLAGDRTGAIRRYELLRRRLDEALGVPPMAETRALYDAIITDTFRPEPAPGGLLATYHRPSQPRKTPHMENQLAGDLPFTGRAAEIGLLLREIRPGRLVLVEGDPGIGKTRLVQEFIRQFDGLVLEGPARELEQNIPYHPFSAAFHGLARLPRWIEVQAGLALPQVWLEEAARLVPDLLPRGGAGYGPEPPLAGLPGPAAESRLWEGLSRFLAALAHRQPLLIFLDDLQWADESTLALLGYLLRHNDRTGLHFIATIRPAPVRAPLRVLRQALLREGRLFEIPLASLSVQEVAALAAAFKVEQNAELTAWLYRNSEGSPFVLVELLRYLRTEGLLAEVGESRLDGLKAFPVVPNSVYSLIQSRLAHLSDGARRLLDVAVVAGREFSFELVEDASGLSEMAALDALDELLAARLIITKSAGRYAVDHILTMEVAWREVSAARHALLHRRVAESLEARSAGRKGESAGALAFHFSEGGRPERAAPYAMEAAEQAVRLAAWREAIGFYEMALAGLPGEKHYDLYLKLGEALEIGGEPPRASEAYRSALQLAVRIPDRLLADRARLALARSMLMQGRFDEATGLTGTVLAEGSRELEAEAAFMMGAILSIGPGELEEAAGYLERAGLAARAAENTVMMAAVAFESGSVAAQQGRLGDAIRSYHESLILAEGTGRETAMWQTLSHNNLAYHYLLLGELGDAHDHVQAGMRVAEENGVLGLMPYLFSTSGEISLAEGALDAAESAFNEGLALAELLPLPERVAGLTANLGLLAAKRGEMAAAIMRLSNAAARADAMGATHLAAQIRIWLAPLVPPNDRAKLLLEAREIAEGGGRAGLLAQIEALES